MLYLTVSFDFLAGRLKLAKAVMSCPVKIRQTDLLDAYQRMLYLALHISQLQNFTLCSKYSLGLWQEVINVFHNNFTHGILLFARYTWIHIEIHFAVVVVIACGIIIIVIIFICAGFSFHYRIGLMQVMCSLSLSSSHSLYFVLGCVPLFK